jgi:hemolysin III
MQRAQTQQEERLNSLSHAAGIVWCLCTIPYCMYTAYNSNNLLPFFSVVIFAIGMLAVYTSSTLYHFTEDVKRKMILKKFDHISIYFLIAGTYTPFIAHFVPTNTAIVFLLIMWGIVGIGIVYKLFFIQYFKWLSVALYLALGWMILFVAKPLQASMPFSVFFWIALGGIFYTIGVYFYVKSAKPYYHSIWHIFVLAGTIAHTMGVYETIK